MHGYDAERDKRLRRHFATTNRRDRMSESGPKLLTRDLRLLRARLIRILRLGLIGISLIADLGAPPSMTPFLLVGPGDPSNQVANDLLLDLKAGRIDTAYGRTSKELQQRLSLDQFQLLMNNHPSPGHPGSEMTALKEDT